MAMSSMIDVEFRCPDTNCYPLARISVFRLIHCQTACLALERCRTINFRQSTNVCELFAEAPDNNDTIFANTGSVLMTIIDGTRVPYGRLNSYVLDIVNSSAGSGAPIVLYPMKNRTSEDPSSQLWFFDQDGTIRNMATEMVIDIDSGIQGTRLILWPKTTGANQQWKFDGLYVLCPGANKVIDIENSDAAPGAHAIAWSNHLGLNQQWNIIPKLR
ncbi:unnamed protein product [Rotaria sp. Silwood1]|nr:unnamed protein product [Rotaria sp. Silwood1]